MKKFIYTLFIFLICSTGAYSTTYTITVSNFQFSPQNIPNVLVGDVIEWVWSNGVHTTTSLTIPTGASPWDAAIDAGSTIYQYTATITGTYNYECSIHSTFMKGSFTVSAPVPVVLARFEVSNNGNQSNLTWITSSEQNSSYFSIKRSVDGSSFNEIGRVNAAGFSNIEKLYSFTDIKLPIGNK